MKFFWHIHHEVLVEPATEPIKNRKKYIRESKPKHEVELRLKLLKPVKGKLPKEVIKVGEAYVKAWEAYAEAYYKAGAYYKTGEAYNKAWEAYNKAWEAYVKTLKKHKKEIEALHKKECKDCPWDGETIFP